MEADDETFTVTTLIILKKALKSKKKGDRGEKATKGEETQRGGGKMDFGRGIKRVLIQLGKIYDLMRMWLGTL